MDSSLIKRRQNLEEALKSGTFSSRFQWEELVSKPRTLYVDRDIIGFYDLNSIRWVYDVWSDLDFLVLDGARNIIEDPKLAITFNPYASQFKFTLASFQDGQFIEYVSNRHPDPHPNPEYGFQRRGPRLSDEPFNDDYDLDLTPFKKVRSEHVSLQVDDVVYVSAYGADFRVLKSLNELRPVSRDKLLTANQVGALAELLESSNSLGRDSKGRFMKR